MSFPQRLQAADSPPSRDHLNIRDVANDFEHWTPVAGEALQRLPIRPGAPIRTSSGLHKVITPGDSGEP
jgi:hypothetical protein